MKHFSDKRDVQNHETNLADTVGVKRFVKNVRIKSQVDQLIVSWVRLESTASQRDLPK